MNSEVFTAKKTNHIFVMTTKIGFYQFAEKTTPNRKFGFSIDDQARALILALLLYQQKKEKKYLALAKIYLNFIERAQRKDGYFHNFADAQGKFIDKIGSEDCFGRAIWALGFCQGFGPENIRQRAEKIFNQAFKNIAKIHYLRSKAYLLLGLLDYWALVKTGKIEKICRLLACSLQRQYKKNSQKNWHFFEKKLTYANAILPYALLSNYEVFKNKKDKEVGLKTLNFLDRACRFKGFPAPIGNQGWYERGGKKAKLDPQPIEAADMVLAAVKAYQVTGSKKYYKMAKEWFAWFLGNNIFGYCFFDKKTGGCHDGTRGKKLNPDEGAESTILFHLADLALKSINKKNASTPKRKSKY